MGDFKMTRYMKKRKPNYKDLLDEYEPPRVQFKGPRRRARDNEHWFPIVDDDSTTFVLAKNKPNFNDLLNVFRSPWLTHEEKVNKCREMGATEEAIRRADKQSSGAYR